MSSSEIRLACLEGAAPPPRLAPDLARLAALSDAARSELARVLPLVAPEPVPEPAEAQLARFAEAHGIDGDALGEGLRAARFLVRAAARIDAPLALFVADLRRLAPDDVGEQLVAALSPAFEPAKGVVKAEAIVRTLAAHGPVLRDVEWRVDQMASSSHGRGLGAPVVWLTLHVERDGKTEAISVQALPTMVQRLKAACEAIVK